MLTSDERVIDGARYELEMRPIGGGSPVMFNLSSEQFSKLLDAWKRAERERGHRLQLAELMDVLLSSALDGVERNTRLPCGHGG